MKMGRGPMDKGDRGEKREGETKKIKMFYVYVPIPQDKYIHYALKKYTNQNFKNYYSKRDIAINPPWNTPSHCKHT